jgi:hypothetical protein
LTATTSLSTLEQWCEENPIKENLIFKSSAVDQGRIFVNMTKIFGGSKTVLVDGMHRSKSVLLPVYHLNMWPGIGIWARDNFYNWKVSVDSRFDIHVNEDIFDTETEWTEGYCEGMVGHIFGPWSRDRRRFTIECRNEIFLAILFESIRLSRDMRPQP